MKGLIKYELDQISWLLQIVLAILTAVYILTKDLESLGDAWWVIVVELLILGSGNTVREDEKNGWLTLQGILPVSKRQYLLAKYLRYELTFAVNAVYIFSLVAIRLALLGRLSISTFWHPLPLYLSMLLACWSVFPGGRYVDTGDTTQRLIKLALCMTVVGGFVIQVVAYDDTGLMCRLLPLGWCLWVIAAGAFVMNTKKNMDQFESYQIGIPSELQLDDRAKKGRKK